MKAKFYAFDAQGKQQKPLSSEISIMENGTSRKILSISCPTEQPLKQVSVTMSFDISASMNSSWDGESPIALVKDIARQLIGQLALPPSEASLQSCNDTAHLVEDFTSTRSKLYTSLGLLRAEGENDFAEQLLNPTFGLLNIAKKGKYKKFAILYTDALWFKLTPAQLQQCIAICKTNDIQFYSVLIQRPEIEKDGIRISLQALADSTGGVLYDGVRSEQTAVDVAQSLQESIQGGSPCEILWESEVSCSAPQDVQVTWNAIKDSITYNKPSKGVALLEISPAALHLPSKPIGEKFDTTVVVTALNAPFVILDINDSNGLFDISPKSFVLNAGQSQTLTVSYVPSDSSYSWTTFNLQTQTCDQILDVSAGFSGIGPKVSIIKLILPNGNEVFLGSSDTIIKWGGIPLTDTVRLEFSLDSGITWNVIEEKVTGGEYLWRVPESQSALCLVKVTHLSKDRADWAINYGAWSGRDSYIRRIATDVFGNVYATGKAGVNIFVSKYGTDGVPQWVQYFGATEEAYCFGYAIALDQLGNIYVTGGFSGRIKIGNVTLNSIGSHNIFIAKFRNDGSVEWANRAGGAGKSDSGEDQGLGITVDGSGNAYVCGAFEGVADFDTIQISNKTGKENESDIFIAKYNPNGRIIWVKRAGGNERDVASGICKDLSSNIFVTGCFSGTSDFDGVTLQSKGAQDIFIAKYSSEGALDWVKGYGGPQMDVASGVSIDNLGNLYLTGSFSDTFDFGSSKLQSRGGYDVFIAKLNNDGSVAWSKQGGGASADVGLDITADRYGNVYVCGNFNKQASFDSIVIKGSGASNGYCYFIVQYSPNGSINWAKQPLNDWWSSANAISIDPQQNIYVSGHFIVSLKLPDTTLYATNTQSDHIYFWKIVKDSLKFDLSDTVFAITVKGSVIGSVPHMGTLAVVDNPFTNNLIISYDLERSQEVRINITDVFGRPIYGEGQGFKHAGNHQLSIASIIWPTGSYYIRLSTSSGDVKTVKVVKQ